MYVYIYIYIYVSNVYYAVKKALSGMGALAKTHSYLAGVNKIKRSSRISKTDEIPWHPGGVNFDPLSSICYYLQENDDR